ncbi:twitching motility protein PilT [Chloroflexus islandicus]|uniref:Twitching motility protein PilT n=1 Tax=Chloroflexus islandicus TaxID=1707952 RepID=A0A178M878_9CHLR|nr:PIN domain-containing protein [Chloroflexus islandicus]OAN44970.1 twitching motility protein PilT [Chloroflexus islandicus]
MRPSLDFIVRLIGFGWMAYLGLWLGRSLSGPNPTPDQILATALLMLAGGGLGLILAPRLIVDPLRSLFRQARVIPLSDVMLAAIGILIGLFAGVLLTVPLAMLPAPYGNLLPIIATAILVYFSASILYLRKRDLIELINLWRQQRAQLTPSASPASETTPAPATGRRYLIDTSAIIDGRIAAVVRTGFMEGTLLIPSFVLAELQMLADSNDDLRRQKGRRGLELLNQMQQSSPLPIEILNHDLPDVLRVDDKLIELARQHHCPIITNDYNLNRVAGLQGITVLSINQLSDALRPPVMQDQRLHILIRNEGNTRQQGVGYLDDGTPVIVENARHLIGQTIEVVVTRIHQTQTGRLIFAIPAEEA